MGSLFDSWCTHQTSAALAGSLSPPPSFLLRSLSRFKMNVEVHTRRDIYKYHKKLVWLTLPWVLARWERLRVHWVFITALTCTISWEACLPHDALTSHQLPWQDRCPRPISSGWGHVRDSKWVLRFILDVAYTISQKACLTHPSSSTCLLDKFKLSVEFS